MPYFRISWTAGPNQTSGCFEFEAPTLTDAESLRSEIQQHTIATVGPVEPYDPDDTEPLTGLDGTEGPQ